MLCCKSTKDPKKIKGRKVKAILKGILGGFLVLSVAYHGHFWHGLSEDLTSTFREAVGALVKKVIYFKRG